MRATLILLGIPLLTSAASLVSTSDEASGITPTQGRFGTPVTITLESPGATRQFNETTTVSWTGVYDPPKGPNSSSFTIEWSAAEVTVPDPGTAVVVMGAGSSPDPPDVAALHGLGTFIGTATITTAINAACPADLNIDGVVDGADLAILLANYGDCPAPCPSDFNGDGLVNGADLAVLLATFGDCPEPLLFELTEPFNFTLIDEATQWHVIHYPDGPGGLEPQEIGVALTEVNLMLISILPDQQPTVEVMMMAAHSYHMTAVVRIEQNTHTLINAPATFVIDVVSLSQSGAELDYLEDIVLERVDDDGDPDNITYHSDLLKPIMVVDTPLNEAMYPDLLLIEGEADGFAVIAPDFIR